jgi:hypothetical protein
MLRANWNGFTKLDALPLAASLAVLPSDVVPDRFKPTFNQGLILLFALMRALKRLKSDFIT